MDMKEFAIRLRHTRIQRNVTVDELAAAIKVNRSTINRYETAGFKSIKEAKLDAIAEYLMVNKDYLCGKTDEQFGLSELDLLGKQENIEINKVIHITTEIIKQKNVTMEGKPIKDLQYLIDTIELALEMLKKKNKGGN